jgi:hypothetical protein
MPRSLWRQLDSPLPPESRTLGAAFEVWHAMLRAERALRLSSPAESATLRRAAKALRSQLERRIQPPEPASDEALIRYVRLVASDEIYGTLNPLSTAAVLRAEIFPERADHTPSYLAGHILFSELAIARRRAAHNVSGAPGRSPRLAVISQAVHSVMLYVEHLRKRSRVFEKIAHTLLDVARVHRAAQELRGVQAEETAKAISSHLRFATARLITYCEECDLLLLATRPFFEAWSKELEAGLVKRPIDRKDKDHKEDQEDDSRFATMPDLAATIARALASLQVDEGAVERVQTHQRDTFHMSVMFSRSLYQQIRSVREALRAVAGSQSYEELLGHIRDLDSSLDKLEDTHRADRKKGTFPSVRDTARFQFAKMLVGLFCEPERVNGQRVWFEPGTGAYHPERERRLRTLEATYLNKRPTPQDRPTPAERGSLEERTYGALLEIGESAIGQGVLQSWMIYEEAYECPPPREFGREPDGEWRKLPANELPKYKSAWLSLRHRSFLEVESLTKEFLAIRKGLTASPDERVSLGLLSSIARVFSAAAVGEEEVAADVERRLREETVWCRQRGHQLLSMEGHVPGADSDPHELAAALWIADRLSQPYPLEFELNALRVLQHLQRADGSFPPGAPLYENRDFLFFLPSASTIATLARFVTGGTVAPNAPVMRQRIERWEPLLRRGAEFLLASLVGRTSSDPNDDPVRRWVGWHTDRYPEVDRIDFLATTEACTALCRVDDALKWLCNLSAGDNWVSWPEKAWESSVPIDCECRAQQLVKATELIRRQRRNHELYTVKTEHALRTEGSCSFVLYGPPGTGKTFFQEVIAGELGWPVVTITPVDFLEEGEHMVARRAKEVFRRLGYFSNVCVVFDEFDELVAERREFRSFPLLTAAMLPLLASLRKHAINSGCIVCFTTNHIENIDQAARRVGRVDESILMMYPDYPARILMGLLGLADRLKGTPLDDEVAVNGAFEGLGRQIELVRRAAERTAVCTYADARRYMHAVLASDADGFQSPQPSIDHTYYKSVSDEKRGVSPEVMRSLKTLVRSVGPDFDVGRTAAEKAEWLSLRVKVLQSPEPEAC